jgi:hypothetical protein
VTAPVAEAKSLLPRLAASPPAAAVLKSVLAKAVSPFPKSAVAVLSKPEASATSKLPRSTKAWLPAPKAEATSPMPPVAVALLSLPSAIAMSPNAEWAVAVPTWNSVSPSIEMAKLFGSKVSAEATPGMAANAAPIPSATTSRPSRPMPLSLFIVAPVDLRRRLAQPQ